MVATLLPRAGLLRRLAALSYDYCIATAIWASAHFLGFAVLLSAQHSQLLPLPAEQPLANYLMDNPYYQGYLILTVVGYFIFSWTHGGQTIGMRAWRLRVVNKHGQDLTNGQAALRCLTALLGLSNLSLLVSPSRRALHDRLSASDICTMTAQDRRNK